MSEQGFFLASSTRAIAGSENAVHLIEQKERVEQAVVSGDSALALDTAKAFLETVFKTVLSDRSSDADLNQDLAPLFKSVKSTLRLNRDNDAHEIIGRLASSVVHNIGELRNKYGAASHGKDGHYENPIEMPEAEMVAILVDAVAGFVFHKHKSNGDPSLAMRIYYQDYSEFNDFWDNQNESYKFQLAVDRELEILPSKLLYMSDQDSIAYREMLLQYLSTEKDDSVDDQLEAEAITQPAVVTALVSVENSEKLHVDSLEKAAPLDQPIIENMDIFLQASFEMIVSILSPLKRDMDIDPAEIDKTASYISRKLRNLMLIDWENREPTLAGMNNVARIALRRAGYTLEQTQQAVPEIIHWHVINKQTAI